jgi:hypothetical protein
MEKSERIWVATGAAICGVLALIGWSVAIYAFNKTPEIHDIIVKAANGGQSNQSKSVFLFAPPVGQTFLCWMLLNPILRPKEAARKAAIQNAQGGVPVSTWSKFASSGLCVLSSIFLYYLIGRADYVISQL